MADPIIAFLIEQLSTFIRDEGNLLGGLEQGFQDIRGELGHMKAFLSVAEAKEEDDPRLQEWMKQVREVSYDIEDVLDEFTLHFAPHHATGFCGCFRRNFNCINDIQARHSIGIEIQTLISRVKNISDGYQRYKFENGSSHTIMVPVPMINTWLDDMLLEGKAKLVGIQIPTQELISQLLEGDSRLKVISVVGMQGVGKTTLVKKAHEDANVKKEFQISAWVTASQTRNITELLKDLIKQICEQIKKPIVKAFESITGVDKLKSIVSDLLREKRYAIVFDDVCDLDFWNSIKSALPDGGCGSRVMLTTRIRDVAQASCLESQGYVHEMKPLSFKESWNLFCQRIFKNSSCPTNLKNIAQDILSKCEGLPLAIVTMGGILASKDKSKIDEWEMVRRSLGGEEDGTGKLDMVKKVIHLSYKDLPSHLKTCLLYISIFPKDYEIQCHQLIQLWIAERFVQGRSGMTSEEVAFDHLKELIRRSLIQVAKLSWDGSPHQCRIHDLVQEMILCKSQEQNMMTIATGQHTMVGPEKVHRLVINNPLDYTQESRTFNHLRSLITFGAMESLSKAVLNALQSSKSLKVLDFKDVKLEEIPNGIFNLYHLKYLGLRGTSVKTIPKSIKKLQNLEHLHLGGTNVRELPKEILKLQKLRHLRVFQVVDSSDINYKSHGFKPPSKIGGLLSLQTLLLIESHNDTTSIVGEIGKLIQLRELGITKFRQQDGQGLCSSLEKLTNLQELDVTAIEKGEVIDMNHPLSPSSLKSLRELILRGRLETLPQWILQLHNLMKIDLIWSGLRADDHSLESLQHLPNLVQVCLAQAYEGETFCFKAGGFLKLKILNLRNMKELKWIVIEKGSMPRLQQLYLSELPLLGKLPRGTEHLTEMQHLHLSDMSSGITERLQNLHDQSEDYMEIAHIPEIIIAFWENGEQRECRL